MFETKIKRLFVERVVFLFKQGDCVLQNDVKLIHKIEDVVGKQMEKFECKEDEVLADITKVLP